MSNDLKALNQERYARAAENYVASPVHAAGMGIETLVDMVKPQADWHVLDVATGGGHTALLFAQHVAKVVASDFTPRMLQAAQRFIIEQGVEHMSFCGADAEILPFASRTFDLVTCRVAAHHFPDIFAFVQDAVRVLKPNGLLLVHDHVVSDDKKVADYVNAYEKLRDPAHARALPEYEWRGIYQDTGLSIEHVEQRMVKHDVLPWAKRQNCDDETIERLQVMLLRAPDKVLKWMQPDYAGTEYARYNDHHIFIVGRKGE
jgi:ubiquinone/menaquinone biosynthesis C-methylase UbiE